MQGFDNRSRFYVINLSCYFSFLLINLLLNHIVILTLIFLILSITLSALTTLRRLKDAELHQNWLLAPTLAYAITGIVIILIASPYANWLILLPIIVSALLLTYPSKHQNNYILGYFGPVDLSEYVQENTKNPQRNTRIEPTFNQIIHDHIEQESAAHHNQNFNSSSKQKSNNDIQSNDIGEIIRVKLLKNKNFVLLAVAILTIVIFSILLNATIFNLSTQQRSTDKTSINKNNINQDKSQNRQFPVTMPDNFTLLLSPYNGIFIHWQANEPEETLLWSINTAQGNESCQNIRFNNGDTFRILAVQVENNQDHYASFSPLDTQALLQDLAFRNKFTLCDFEFSLKGSQAALGKNSHYSDLIEY